MISLYVDVPMIAGGAVAKVEPENWHLARLCFARSFGTDNNQKYLQL